MDQLLSFFLEHWILSSAFIIVLGLLITTGQASAAHGVRLLTADDMVMLMNREKTTVIDIRSADAFKQGHILGAVSLPDAEPSAFASGFDKTVPMVIVGQAETSALRLASKLVKQDYKQVCCLRGGLATWREANLPLTQQ